MYGNTTMKFVQFTCANKKEQVWNVLAKLLLKSLTQHATAVHWGACYTHWEHRKNSEFTFSGLTELISRRMKAKNKLRIKEN
jgi:hypothetical protein